MTKCECLFVAYLGSKDKSLNPLCPFHYLCTNFYARKLCYPLT